MLNKRMLAAIKHCVCGDRNSSGPVSSTVRTSIFLVLSLKISEVHQ